MVWLTCGWWGAFTSSASWETPSWATSGGRGQVTVPVYGTIIQISARVILSYALIRPMGLSGVALATGLGWVLV